LLRFWHPIIVAYPDALVRDLVAHELAHVVQRAIGQEFPDKYECEMDADWRVEDWGFSATAMDDWDRVHGLTRVFQWDTLNERQRRRISARADRAGRATWLFS
jgi:hypothetical protein